MSKPYGLARLWDKHGGHLFIGHVATVVKVARLIHRLEYGTRESHRFYKLGATETSAQRGKKSTRTHIKEQMSLSTTGSGGRDTEEGREDAEVGNTDNKRPDSTAGNQGLLRAPA